MGVDPLPDSGHDVHVTPGRRSTTRRLAPTHVRKKYRHWAGASRAERGLAGMADLAGGGSQLKALEDSNDQGWIN